MQMNEQTAFATDPGNARETRNETTLGASQPVPLRLGSLSRIVRRAPLGVESVFPSDVRPHGFEEILAAQHARQSSASTTATGSSCHRGANHRHVTHRRGLPHVRGAGPMTSLTWIPVQPQTPSRTISVPTGRRFSSMTTATKSRPTAPPPRPRIRPRARRSETRSHARRSTGERSIPDRFPPRALIGRRPHHPRRWSSPAGSGAAPRDRRHLKISGSASPAKSLLAAPVQSSRASAASENAAPARSSPRRGPVAPARIRPRRYPTTPSVSRRC